MNTPTDRFLTGSLTGSFLTQSDDRFPVPSPTGTGTGQTGSFSEQEPVEPVATPKHHHPSPAPTERHPS